MFFYFFSIDLLYGAIAIDQISTNFIHTKATTIAARMTRIKRIYADFYHAFGAIGIRLATKTQSHKATKKTFSIQRTLCLRAFVAKNTLPQAKQNLRHPRCY
jgi:hypothetical protein